MKKKNIFWFHLFFFMGVVDIFTCGCKKIEDKPQNKTFDKGFIQKLTYGTLTDIDGNVYKTIAIGTQTWMAENLKVVKLNNGVAIPNITDNNAWAALTSAGFCWYNNDSANKDKYGALYNFYALQFSNICPKGWHVPIDLEWITLENYLIANGYNYDTSTTGNKIAKALASEKNWPSSIVIGAVGNFDYDAKRNLSGFTALPGGYRSRIGDFGSIGNNGEWWDSYSSSFGISFNYSSVFRNIYPKSCGFCVRCVMNN
jgi:uncharacterized protein (TIGR02145 family)